MEIQEYNEKLKKIEADYNQAKQELYRDYGMSQAKFKVGDIIKDSRFSVLIDKITVYKMFNIPEPVYHGVELKKDLTPRKDGSRAAIHGNKNVELVKSAK